MVSRLPFVFWSRSQTVLPTNRLALHDHGVLLSQAPMWCSSTTRTYSLPWTSFFSTLWRELRRHRLFLICCLTVRFSGRLAFTIRPGRLRLVLALHNFGFLDHHELKCSVASAGSGGSAGACQHHFDSSAGRRPHTVHRGAFSRTAHVSFGASSFARAFFGF